MEKENILNKQESEQAIPPAPDYIQEIIRESKKEIEIEPGEKTDKLLIELAKSEAWLVLKKFINDKRKKLEIMTRESVRKDAFNLQNTGFRYLIFDQVDAFAQDLINKVESHLKLHEEQQRNS